MSSMAAPMIATPAKAPASAAETRRPPPRSVDGAGVRRGRRARSRDLQQQVGAFLRQFGIGRLLSRLFELL